MIMHEKKLKEKMQNRDMALKQKMDVANHVAKVAEEKCILMKESQKKREDEVLNEYINKVQERKKQIAQNTKRITEDKESAKERLERIKDEQKFKAREAARSINEDIKRRHQSVEATMALKNEELEQRKEISMLRRLDHQENYSRSKNFHNLYKQKLAEKILEKASRVQKSFN